MGHPGLLWLYTATGKGALVCLCHTSCLFLVLQQACASTVYYTLLPGACVKACVMAKRVLCGTTLAAQSTGRDTTKTSGHMLFERVCASLTGKAEILV